MMSEMGVYTVTCDALEGLGQERPPMLVQGIQPWRIMFRLEVMGVLMRILLLHNLEAGHIELGDVLAIVAGAKGKVL